MALCGAILTVVGVVLGGGLPTLLYVWGGCVSPMIDLALDHEHASAEGVITDKRVLRHIQINSRHPWKVGVRFTTPNGATVDAVGYTYEQAFANKAIGDRVNVEYGPADPSRARLVGGSAAILPPSVYLLIFAVLGSDFVIGALLLIVTGRRARNERILLVYGDGAEAEVIRVRPVKYISFGFQHPYDIYYRFKDRRGLEVTGKDRTYHYAWAKNLEPKDRVGVIYNPHSPAANALWLHGGDIGPGG